MTPASKPANGFGTLVTRIIIAAIMLGVLGVAGVGAYTVGRRSNGHDKGDPRLGERVAHNEACIDQLTRGQERIEGKLDRIIERLPPR